jgi:hypothetical protein
MIDKLAQAGKDFASVTGSSNTTARNVASLVGVSPEQLEGIFTALEQPSLCFIPIKSETLVMRRSVDVGTTMLISQVDQTKDFLTDNSAPHPRVWTGTGYISSLIPYHENGLMIKPSIQVQMAVLDAAADSRQPVKFKTDMGEIVDVLVQDLQISSTTKGPGVKQVSYVVQEVKILENSILAGSLAELSGKAGAGSIPQRVLANLGKNSLVGSGSVNGAAALLSIKF